MVAEARGALRIEAVNASAEEAGIAPAMALADGRAILPALETAPADENADTSALARLAGWCVRYSPWAAIDPVRTAGDGSLWLDVSGCAHLFDGERALLDDLLRRLGDAGYAARAGLAETPGAAWAVARFAPDAITIVAPGETRAALAALPVAALRLEAETAAGLGALGLRRIGDLLELPRAALAARFGNAVAGQLDAALGRAPEPISPLPPAATHFARLAFAEPVALTDDLDRAVRRLADTLCAGLEAAGHGARRLVLTLFEPDGGFHRIEIGAGRPSRDPGHLARLFGPRLDGVTAEFGIEAMTLAAPDTETLDERQPDLAGDNVGDGAGDDDESRLIDRLANRLGAAHVIRFAARESHIPERAQRVVPAMETSSGEAGQAGRASGKAAWPTGRRPLRLLAHPEAIEATAPVPDDPPVMFRWRRVLHRIARADGPERITPEWWRDADTRDGVDLRDYYRVEDTDGRRFWLYRQGLYRADAPASWFLHGIFE